MKCARCDGEYKVVESCASSPDAPSCLYCREFFISEFRLESVQKHLHSLLDWMNDKHPQAIADYFKGHPNG